GIGHRQSDCPKNPRKGLSVDEIYDESDGEPIYDSEVIEDSVKNEEHMTGDVGPVLVVRRNYLTSYENDDEWLHNNIFQSMCTIRGKVCRFIIDSGICENMVAEEVVKKLEVPTQKHPKLYKLAWLKKSTDVTVSQRALISFSIRVTYKDEILYDVVSIDACHLLLGRPWQFNRHSVHDGRTNTYSFMFGEKKIALLPGKTTNTPTMTGDSTNLLTQAKFESKMVDSGVVFILVGKFIETGLAILNWIRTLIEEFQDVFPRELPDGLPPL
ncbi:hypothetical protein TorRG33x02_281190, partial [Trema orientale]